MTLQKGDTAYLQWNIGKIVDDEHQCSDADQIARPGKGQQAQCYDVMHKHDPKVLALDVEELREKQRKVES